VSVLLASARFAERHAGELARIAREAGAPLEVMALPKDPTERVSDGDCARVEAAHFSGDVFPDHSRAFFSALHRAANLRWMHSFSVGLDHPVFRALLDRGVALTNSAGANAAQLAQTLISGLLLLARGFPHWLDAQSRRSWASQPTPPRALDEQTLVVVGLGAIGGEVARLGRALGLHTIGVRRSAARSDDPVHELVPAARLAEVLPRADFLALTCPLTEQTRGLIDREALARLPAGARVLNVGRGEVIDEPALVEALQSGRLGGAYLDVFETEPLPEDSALWSLPNVIVTPHNSASSTGSLEREAPYFLDNLDRWLRGRDLRNRAE
jgi:phosphoglycerate dehydrogenase-like enzyme